MSDELPPLPDVASLIDAPPKYRSREEEAESTKRYREKRAKAIDDLIESLPEQAFSRDYLEEHGDKWVHVSFLSRELAKLSKKMARETLEHIFARSDSLEKLIFYQRDRCRVLEREVAALKASVARGFRLRGTFVADATYAALDVVALDGSSFAAKRDNPGPCPGDGWQLLVQRGKPGRDGKHTQRG
jgi:hypothetical protein